MALLRTSLLNHLPEPAQGLEAHFDWLLETAPSDPSQRAVPTWRVGKRIDQMAPGAKSTLQRIGLHRGAWLELEEPTELSGGRGRVLPCNQGRIQASDFSKNELWTVTILWNDDSEGHYLIQDPDLESGLVTRLANPA